MNKSFKRFVYTALGNITEEASLRFTIPEVIKLNLEELNELAFSIGDWPFYQRNINDFSR